MKKSFLTPAILAIVCLSWIATSLEAAPIPVRFLQGVTRGFLSLRSQEGEKLADGDILQVAKDDRVTSRLVFRFADGSRYDETVVFSQDRVLTLQHYHLVQRGPSFPTTLDISLDRKSGRYEGRYADKGEEERAVSGTLEMPPDLYNGMILTLLQNLPQGGAATVQMAAFTPAPRLVKLPITPVGEESMRVGDVSEPAVHFQARPEIGGILGFLASLVGKNPPALHYWITREEIPAFLGFEGPLFYGGPVWRIGSSYRSEPPKEVAERR